MDNMKSADNLVKDDNANKKAACVQVLVSLYSSRLVDKLQEMFKLSERGSR